MFAHCIYRPDQLGCARFRLAEEQKRDATKDECLDAVRRREFDPITVADILYAWSQGLAVCVQVLSLD